MDSSLRLLSIPIFITVNIIFNGSCSSLMQEERQDGTSRDTIEQNQGSAYFLYQAPQYPRDCKEVLNQCSSPAASGVFLVKPEGYLDPFEVYCDNDIDDGGWTVIQRRIDGSLDFGRHWEDYKEGFGFLSSEFWLGNDQVAFLTNQAQYELRVDVTIANETFSVRYDAFRLGDEWSNYAFVKVGIYEGDEGSLYTECPTNTIYTNCTCVPTCEDPLKTTDNCQSDCNGAEACMCRPGYLMKGNDCVEPSECGCYLPEDRIVIPNGGVYVNVDCSKRCTCSNDTLSCDANYQCDSNAACRIKDGVRQCHCNRGYEGDGQTCVIFTDCTDVYNAGHTQDGVYSIHPSGWNGASFNVFCNMTIDGGRWTVFQRRKTGSTTFYKTWVSYRNGFGNIRQEFWLGNEKLHYLTQQANYELRIDIVSSSNTAKYAKYERFRVNDETNNYRVTQLTSYSGNAGNGMHSVENIAFSTHDRDNDGLSWGNCAYKHRGGWWYGGKDYDNFGGRVCDVWPRGSAYATCAYGNLNGDYTGSIGENIFWAGSSNCNIKYTEMKIRRVA